LKKNTVTLAVCIFFAAVLTAENTYAATTDSVLVRDCLGYAYAAIAAAAMLWLYISGKKQVDPEPGRFAAADWEYFYFGAAVTAVSVNSFLGVFPAYNENLFRLDAVTQGPFLVTRMLFSCLGFVAGPLLLAAGAVRKPAFKAFSTAFAAIWSFIYLVSECTFFIPLPDISLYLPRLGTAVFTTLAFCCITMAGKVGLHRSAAGLRSCSGMLVMFSISDAVFWLVYHNNAYHEMLFSSLLFSALFGLYFIWLSSALDFKFQPLNPTGVTDNEI